MAAAKPRRRRSRMGHVLRHPPLRRLADLPARGARRRFAGPLERRRANRRSSRPARQTRRHAPLRHAVALAPSADERRRSAPLRRVTCGSPERSPTRRFSTACACVFPQAQIGHAYASTEAGVGFDVNDGLAGFPADISSGEIRDGVEMRVVGRLAAHPLRRGQRRAMSATEQAPRRRRRLRRYRRYRRAAR